MADELRRGDLLGPGRTGGARRPIGRDEEVEALTAALAGLRGGAGRAIALVGEPGIGKSALLGAAASLAHGVAVPVQTSRARVPIPSSGLDDLSGLGGVGSGRATDAPRVAVLDDLHLLAADQAPHVAALIQATASLPLLCLIAYRPRQLTSALASVLAQAAASGLLEVWALGQLSADQAAELLGDRPDAAEVNRAALGNPLYLKAIGGSGEASAEAVTAILGELADLGPHALDVVQAAAVLGAPSDAELLAAVTGLGEPQALRALDELTRLDLVRSDESEPRFALRHEAVRDVVYRRLEPSRRTELHRRAALALAGRSAPIGQRAHHVARAADPSRPESAATLVAAARDALYTTPAIAVGYLQAALALVQQDPEHAYEARVLLARARLMTGDAFEGRDLLDALRAEVPGTPGAVATLADSSRIERRLGRYSEASAIARSGLAALADRDSATATALHIYLSDDAYDRQEFAASRQHAELAADIARRHGDAVGQANALAQAALGHLFTGDLATALSGTDWAAELIDASSDSALLTNLEAPLQLGNTEGMLGRYADADRHVSRAAVLSQQSGQTYITERLLTVLANTQVRSGRLSRALASLDEAARHAERVSAPAEQAISAMVRAEILFWKNDSGDAREMAESAARALAIASDSSASWAVSVRCFHAEFSLHTGDPGRARLLLLEAAGGDGLPGITAWRRPRCCDTLAECAFILGDHASVEQWAVLAETCLKELPSPGRRGFALRARMRAQVARGDIEGALRRADEVAAEFSAGGERIEVARTLLASATISLDAGRHRGVENRLSHAALLAEQCGSARLAAWVAQLRTRLTAAEATTRPTDSYDTLTAREQEIADLASTGMTNGGIAQSLFLSVRTVETHLRQVYRKLGVTNRAGLTWTLLNRRGNG